MIFLDGVLSSHVDKGFLWVECVTHPTESSGKPLRRVMAIPVERVLSYQSFSPGNVPTPTWKKAAPSSSNQSTIDFLRTDPDGSQWVAKEKYDRDLSAIQLAATRAVQA